MMPKGAKLKKRARPEYRKDIFGLRIVELKLTFSAPCGATMVNIKKYIIEALHLYGAQTRPENNPLHSGIEVKIEELEPSNVSDQIRPREA